MLGALHDRVRTVEARTASVLQKVAKGKKPRALLIDGVRYRGVNPAARKLKRSNNTIYDWIASGRARYVG